MSTIVKSTPEAIASIQLMAGIINGGLTEQISALDREGRLLSDPTNWDGPLAAQFRSTWPETHQRLQATRDQLIDLKEQLARIQANIQQAGGAG